MGENEFNSGSAPPDMPSGDNGGTPPDMPSGDNGGTPPDMPSGDNGGTPPDMAGGGGNSSNSVSYSATTSITSAGTYSNQTYNSSTSDQNAVLVSLASGTVNLVNPTVTKTGDSDGGESSNFYGTNSAILATGGGTVSIVGGSITANANGANGVFSYGGNGGQNGAAGDGTTVIISDTTIKTTGSNGGGIMTTGGGVTKASNLTVTTTGNSSAAIRSDRGGGTVSVSGGSYTSNGLGSPAVYSTADITIENATLTSNLSEGVCIEGKNSVTLNDCTLTARNLRTNGNAQFLCAVILYQSQSGDAASGTATFSMDGGTITSTSGHVFHVTNTAAVINLDGVTIKDTGDQVLLSVCDDGWSGASNVATLNASNQILDGDILVGDDSTLTLNLSNSSTFTGDISGIITNNADSVISSSVGTVNVSLDSSSKWYLEDDTYISSFSGTAANVITGGHTLYVNNSPLSGTTESEENTTPSTVVTALNIANSVNNTLITGTELADTISNSGSNVTIQALGGNDSIQSSGNSIIIDAGAGENSIRLSDHKGAIIVFNDQTTVEGFNTGFGDGTDTIHIKGNPPSVDFKANGLTFYDDNNSILLKNVTSTAKVNLYYDEVDGKKNVLKEGVFIADNEWYDVGKSGAAEYYVGVTAKMNHGVDFSGVSTAIDVTLDTDYASKTATFWVNNVYSIKGGAGNTTITGSEKSDTIIAGTGKTTINAAKGDDRISVSSAQVLIDYSANDGNDLITGFNANSTLKISGASYSLTKSGSNLIVTVDDDKITLQGAANLEELNIVGTSADSVSSATTSGGSSSSATSNGSSSSTKDSDSSSSTKDSNSSTSTKDSGSSSSTKDSSSSSSTKNGGSSTSTTDGSSTSTKNSGSSTSTTDGSSTSTKNSGSSTSSTDGSSTSTKDDSSSSVTSGIDNSSVTGGDDSSTTTNSTTDKIIYAGGDAVIEDYESGEKIILGAYTGAFFFEDNFFVTSETGALTILDAQDKVIDLRDAWEDPFIKAYAATTSGIIDGRGIEGFEIIEGATGFDIIYAGDEGSRLWGGTDGVADVLVGGDGMDTFLCGKYFGADTCMNTSASDVVNIFDATLSDIVATGEMNGTIAIQFNTGNVIAVQSSEALSSAFVLADGSAWRYNHATKSWQTA